MISVLFLFLLLEGVSSFSATVRTRGFQCKTALHSHADAVDSVNDAEALAALGLTPQLVKYANGLRNVADDKLRYQQLLFLAAKCSPMASNLKIDTNKVPGCLSTVYVDATIEQGKVAFTGDSDAQLTKGLVAMLVTGLSGHTADEIEQVDPKFIQYAGIANSLTPGRNNGFLNMLQLMKVKAREISALQTSKSDDNDTPIYQNMVTKLSMLKPSILEIEDESYKHAGHAGMEGSVASETHFNLRIVAECFDGLTRVQRHKMIYTVLAQEMQVSISLSLRFKSLLLYTGGVLFHVGVLR